MFNLNNGFIGEWDENQLNRKFESISWKLFVQNRMPFMWEIELRFWKFISINVGFTLTKQRWYKSHIAFRRNEKMIRLKLFPWNLNWNDPKFL